MREDFFFSLNPKGLHKIAMTVWGEEHKSSAVPIICVHGLARNGRDFDKLAAALSRTRTVYCPDMAGRGKSDDLSETAFYNINQYLVDITALIVHEGLVACGQNTNLPEAAFCDVRLYLSKMKNLFSQGLEAARWEGKEDLLETTLENIKQYSADITTCLAHSGARQVDWVGTSMGGLMGMILASVPGSPIRRLVLNDVGPVVKKESIDWMKEYLSIWKTYKSLTEVEEVMRHIYKGFGALPDEDWAHMAAHGVRPTKDGRLSFAYDPKLVEPLKALEADVELWPVYDAISCPTLLLRGAESKLLPAELAEEMTRRGPKPRLRTFPKVGHAPSLMVQDQIEVVTEFLN